MTTIAAQPFLEFVREREAIRLLRLKHAEQPPPWTADPILQRFRFCNIRRRDDRVSQWILQYVIGPYKDAAYLGQWLALGRFVNWPPTLADIIEAGYTPDKPMAWGDIADLIDKRQGKTWTGAYVVRAEPSEEGKKKGHYVCKVIRTVFQEQAAMLRKALEVKTRQAVWAVFEGGYGWGSFMAGQVVDDWAWTPLLADAYDHYTWAPQGPGSIRGLNRVLGRSIGCRFTEAEWLDSLMGLREEVIKLLGPVYDDITLHDISNCLCEFDKYERVRCGQGRPRSYYRPETAY